MKTHINTFVQAIRIAGKGTKNVAVRMRYLLEPRLRWWRDEEWPRRVKAGAGLVDFLYKGDINYKKLAETVSLVPRLLDELEWYELNKTKLEAQIELLAV